MYRDFKTWWIVTTPKGGELRRVHKLEATCVEDAIADAEKAMQAKFPNHNLTLEHYEEV